MKEKSRIRFNPVTKEIEVEGSEEFVKTYFGKLQEMISGDPEETVKEPKAVKVRTVKKTKKEPKAKAVKAHPPKKEPKAAKPRPTKKAIKATKKAPGVKRVTNIDMIVGLIQGSAEGISTAELKEKTGLAESQIWNIVNRASKLGKIKKMKRGIYGVS
jgi:predicted Zn-dependent peptidase